MTQVLGATFWARVQKTADCWVWIGPRLPTGYGTMKHNRKPAYAHRMVWTALRGPIPDGWEIDHLCRNRSCVNPDHLEPVTRKENCRRAGLHRRQSHCPRGHQLTESNIAVGQKSRRCKTCYEASQAAYRAAHRETARAYTKAWRGKKASQAALQRRAGSPRPEEET